MCAEGSGRRHGPGKWASSELPRFPTDASSINARYRTVRWVKSEPLGEPCTASPHRRRRSHRSRGDAPHPTSTKYGAERSETLVGQGIQEDPPGWPVVGRDAWPTDRQVEPVRPPGRPNWVRRIPWPPNRNPSYSEVLMGRARQTLDPHPRTSIEVRPNKSLDFSQGGQHNPPALSLGALRASSGPRCPV